MMQSAINLSRCNRGSILNAGCNAFVLYGTVYITLLFCTILSYCVIVLCTWPVSCNNTGYCIRLCISVHDQDYCLALVTVPDNHLWEGSLIPQTECMCVSVSPCD